MTDLKKLVESKRVIPKDPERSRLLKRITSGEMPPDVDFEDPRENPPPLPRPSPQEIAVLRGWIQAGAPDSAPKTAERPFLADLDILKFIHDDLERINPRERRFTRYFTLTHRTNAGDNEDQLQTYRHGLSKLINSLSWNRRIKAPTPIDPGRTILRIDLRDYLWDEGIWESILDSYPYGLHYEGAAAKAIEELTACRLPLVRADWFVYAASRPPLYHEVLRLPESIEALERKLDVDVAANIRQDRVARAAFNASGVSRNNRLIERHESTNGGYWRSYDFGGSADRKNVFAHPLGPGDGPFDFDYDGGEIVFALPNGLNGYMLIDGRGNRIEKGPTEIVRDNKQSDGAVINGISCMSCHNKGLIEKTDQLREVVAKTRAFDKEVIETVMALYPPRDKMDDLLRGDLERFARAVKETGSALSRTEPVFALAVQFEQELNVDLAAAEAGLMVKEFQDTLGGTPALGQALGLLLVGGTVKRDVFVSAFPMIAEARHLTLLSATRPTSVVDTRPGPITNPELPGFTATAPAGPASRSRSRSSPGTSTTPAPRPATSSSKKAYALDKLAPLPPKFFGSDRDRFFDIAPAGSLLVGVRVSYIDRFGGPKISSIQPIFRSTGGTITEGERHGTVLGVETEAIAKPGFAIGSVRTHTGLTVDGFDVVFMRVKGDHLDAKDAYASPWLGDTNGGSPKAYSGRGHLPAGLQGRAGKEVNAIGLIVVK